ncbi:hypothetical protein BKI52_12090 [marine bacterium AO1-C]|nr:hypothetical protein BKI52_12090 [marine bacterium AO1-C]
MRNYSIIYFLAGILFLFQCAYGQQVIGDSWSKVKTDKKGNIKVIYANNTPFIYQKNNTGAIAGLEFDLITEFASFLKAKYQVSLDIEWKREQYFKDCLENVKNGQGGVFGVSGISITEPRKKEFGFSPAYLPDIELIVSSQNVPLFTKTAEFGKNIANLKAITVKNTTYEENFKDLKNKFFPNLKYSFVPTSDALLDSCIKQDNYWGYMSMPVYIEALNKGKKIYRQHFFNVVREGMAIAFPLSSDWKQPINEFFQQPNFQQLVNRIVNRHFGNFAADLINDASSKSDNKDKEREIRVIELKLKNLLLQRAREKSEQKQSQTRIAYIVLTVFLLLAGIAAWFFYNREKIKKRARRELALKSEEITAQSEHIKESFQRLELISEIGKQVIANLSIESIIETVYGNVIELMPTEEFGVGVYDDYTKSLVYEVYFYKKERLPIFRVPVNKDNRLGIKCFNLREEIVMGDVTNEYSRYLDSLDAYNKDELLNSMICLPLLVGEQAIGMISVQHSDKNAYDAHHVNILRNLAIYTTIAIQNAQVFRQLEQQKDNITASIDYAKQIQKAMLPSGEELKSHLPESFVFLKPRDIVSGDFYYLTTHNEKTVLASVDCTGHGVPGAFLSLIGNDILDAIVFQEDITEADEILNRLHQRVRKVLRQYDTSNRDGMDISLCVIDKKQQTLDFAGAKTSIIYIQQGVMERLKGDKMPIGGEQRETERLFSKQTIDISQPTTFYIYSDGFQDQFGGEDNQKYMAPRFRKFLYSIHQLPMQDQKDALKKELEAWKKDYEQLDDILVVGVKL